jgi:hypothetical protein
MFWSRKPKVTRHQALAARPVQVAKCAIVEASDGGARLQVPVRPSRLAGRIFRVPEGTTKTFELEAIGYSVWKQCDGKTSVQQIIRRLSVQYKISLRETEVSTVAFLQTLVRKGLIGMAVPEPKPDK